MKKRFSTKDFARLWNYGLAAPIGATLATDIAVHANNLLEKWEKENETSNNVKPNIIDPADRGPIGGDCHSRH